MDLRLQQVNAWVQSHLGDHVHLAPASGDASFRRYFRAERDGQSWIVMDAPPDKEDCRPFVAIARHWRSKGVAVPEIIAEDLAQGFLLLEDFGNALYLPALNAQTADALYGNALSALITLQHAGSPANYALPEYNSALLHREMELFREWLSSRLLEIPLGVEDHRLLDDAFSRLAAAALEQPRADVHRDYHSRNLMIRADGSVGILDFQDAVIGPITYDLVSLLRDCYIQWPDEQVYGWVDDFAQALRKKGRLNTDDATFQRWFDLMGMQRHLKAAGIFARLSLRDGKHGYLNDVPRTVGYLRSAAGRHPEFAALAHWLDERFLPAMHSKLKPG